MNQQESTPGGLVCPAGSTIYIPQLTSVLNLIHGVVAHSSDIHLIISSSLWGEFGNIGHVLSQALLYQVVVNALHRVSVHLI